MNTPHVTVIVPSTQDRDLFNNRIKKIFDSQTYANKSLIFDLTDTNVGEKRNALCDQAKGEVVLHMDSDDFYSPDWIAISVAALQSSGADIVGLSKLYFLNIAESELFSFTAPKHAKPWVAGATMCYWKKYWEQWPFQNVRIGEDNQFIWDNPACKVYPHGHKDNFLSLIHARNTSPRNVSRPNWERYDTALWKEKMELWNTIT